MTEHKHKNVMHSGHVAAKALVSGKAKSFSRAPAKRPEEDKPKVEIDHSQRYQEHR